MIKSKLTCEACGASQLARKGAFYVCEYCGSKYYIEKDDTADKLLSASAIDAKITALYAQATVYREEGNYSKELEVLSEALSLDPDNSATYIKLGRCYASFGFVQKALEAYEHAIELDPDDGTAYTNIGSLHFHSKNLKAAARLYEKGLPLIPKNTGDYWVAYANYAIVVSKLGNPKKAAHMIREAERHGYQNGDKCRELAGIRRKLWKFW